MSKIKLSFPSTDTQLVLKDSHDCAPPTATLWEHLSVIILKCLHAIVMMHKEHQSPNPSTCVHLIMSRRAALLKLSGLRNRLTSPLSAALISLSWQRPLRRSRASAKRAAQNHNQPSSQTESFSGVNNCTSLPDTAMLLGCESARLILMQQRSLSLLAMSWIDYGRLVSFNISKHHHVFSYWYDAQSCTRSSRALCGKLNPHQAFMAAMENETAVPSR